MPALPRFAGLMFAVFLPRWLLLAWLLLALATIGLVPLFDYDETVYAQTALDMMHHGQWLVPEANGMRFFEKPPFTYYLMDVCFAIFGENAFAARLPSLLFSLATALLLLWGGRRLHGAAFGWLTALIYLSMFEVGFLAHAAILDAVLNFFVAGALVFYLLWRHEGRASLMRRAALLAGCAVSIKGPVGFVIPLLVMGLDRLLDRGRSPLLRDIPWLSAAGLFLVAALPWYLMILIANGPAFLYEFIWVQNIGRALHPMQGHGGGWYYYLIVFAASVLPWLAWMPWLFGSAVVRLRGEAGQLARVCLLWIGVVMLLFTLAQTKLPHYISSIYPAVALLLAMAWRRARPPHLHRLAWATALVLMPMAWVMLLLPWIYPWLSGLVSHPRALAIVAQPVEPGWMVVLSGGMLLLAIVWLLAGRRPEQAVWRMIVLGMLLQVTLLVGLGGFAARLIQGPLMEMAATVRAAPADMPLYSLYLNAPSVSFYGGRNYAMIDRQKLAGLLGGGEPFMLMLRSETGGELPPAIAGRRPLLDRGGYLLFSVFPKEGG